MNKLLLRGISGAVYCAIIIIAILFGTDYISILTILFSVIGYVEFSKITGILCRKRMPVILLDIAGCIALSMWAYILPVLFWVVIVLMRAIMELYMKEDSPIKSMAFSIFSQIYIGGALGSMIAFPEWLSLPKILLAIFLFIWINDTGAFLVGSAIGHHRLFERISPKKSWEGFWGGMVFCLIASWIFGEYCQDFFGTNVSLPVWGGLGLLCSIFATWGDLFESLIKRTLHIKDSGNIIPGHGGILDRIDSLLFVAPASLIYLLLII